jgi:hypothetical protein
MLENVQESAKMAAKPREEMAMGQVGAKFFKYKLGEKMMRNFMHISEAAR